MTSINVILSKVVRRDYTENDGQYEVRCVHVNTNACQIVTMGEGYPMFQNGLDALESVFLGLFPAYAGQNNLTDCGLRTPASLGVILLQKFGQQCFDGRDVSNGLAHPL